MNKSNIYTIGHGAKSLDDLFEELFKFEIGFLIDIRSKPYSKYYPHFNKEALVNVFKARTDINYSWWGDILGGLPPADWNCYDTDGKIDYDKLGINPKFLSGIERIIKANEINCKVAMMCSEADPQMCHRSKLIGRVLGNYGIEVLHIVRNKRGEIIVKTQKAIFSEIVNEKLDLFSASSEIHLTSRNSYV